MAKKKDRQKYGGDRSLRAEALRNQDYVPHTG